MSVPKLEIIANNIEAWLQDNFDKAVAKPSTESANFKFIKIIKITKVWKEADSWIVNAFIEYSFHNQKIKIFTFQVNKEGEVIGFDLNEPSNKIVSL